MKLLINIAHVQQYVKNENVEVLEVKPTKDDGFHIVLAKNEVKGEYITWLYDDRPATRGFASGNYHGEFSAAYQDFMNRK